MDLTAGIQLYPASLGESPPILKRILAIYPSLVTGLSTAASATRICRARGATYPISRADTQENQCNAYRHALPPVDGVGTQLKLFDNLGSLARLNVVESGRWRSSHPAVANRRNSRVKRGRQQLCASIDSNGMIGSRESMTTSGEQQNPRTRLIILGSRKLQPSVFESYLSY